MRILMIDDHALFRMGLGELLERRGIEVIAALGNCHEGIDKVAELEPDVVLLDMRMPQVNGLQVLIELRQRGAAMPIVMLTTSRDESDVVQSLQNGANGYLLKDMEPDELIEALKNIVAGQTVVAPDLAMILAKALQGDLPEADSPGKSFTHLTKREKEILCLLADGQSNKLIARNLGISDGTVKLHVKSILRKLDISSRVEAAVIAVEQKLCARNID